MANKPIIALIVPMYDPSLKPDQGLPGSQPPAHAPDVAFDREVHAAASFGFVGTGRVSSGSTTSTSARHDAVPRASSARPDSVGR